VLCAIEGRAGQALAILGQLLREDAAGLQVAATLRWALDRLAQASSRMHRGEAWSSVQRDLRVWHDEDRFRRIAMQPEHEQWRRLGLLAATTAGLRGGYVEVSSEVTWTGNEEAKRKVWNQGLMLEEQTALERLLCLLPSPTS
jgi:hypothetical protein